MALEWKPSLTEAVVRSGFSAAYGARPLRRAIQRLCEDSVAEALLGGFAAAGDTLCMEADKQGNVVLTNSRGKKQVYEASAAQGIEEDEAAANAFDAASKAEGAMTTKIKPPKAKPVATK